MPSSTSLPSYAIADLRITRKAQEHTYSAVLSLKDPAEKFEREYEADQLLLMPSTLRERANDAVGYGLALTQMVFGGDLAAGWNMVAAHCDARDCDLLLRLRLDRDDPWLNSLLWETLRFPQEGVFLATSERYMLARYINSGTPPRSLLPPRNGMRTLVVLASPTNQEEYGLSAIGRQEHRARLATVFGTIPVEYLGGHAAGEATFDRLDKLLADEWHVLYLVCHGRQIQDAVRTDLRLVLEQEDGSADFVSGDDLVERLKHSRNRPALVVLATCNSAGRKEDADALVALGPRLAQAGLGGVIAMRDQFSLESAALFERRLFEELLRHGHIARAAAAARRTIQRRSDWWAPTLFMRSIEGILWVEAPAAQPSAPQLSPEQPASATLPAPVTFSTPAPPVPTAPPDTALAPARSGQARDGREQLLAAGNFVELVALCERELVLGDILAASQLAALLRTELVPWELRLRAARLLGVHGDPRDGICTLWPDWCRPLERGLFRSASGVRLPVGSFAIARYPMTVWQYRQFIRQGGYAHDDWWSPYGRLWRDGDDLGRQRVQPFGWDEEAQENLPVTGVTWYEATAFCRWLTAWGRAEGLLTVGEIIRLPTEAELELASAGLPGATEPATPWCNSQECGLHALTPVGLFPEGASHAGALDLVGNMWEWCASLAGDYPQAADVPRDDIADPSVGNQPDLRSYAEALARSGGPALRGGSYRERLTEIAGPLTAHTGGVARFPGDGGLAPSSESRDLGFRVVRALAPDTAPF